ncbi:hypothetical protein, conserved [Leishmania tarentolae]|uniref:Organic solute transport protein 1 n=1 Tax=Leishmania tarentolae TaxID=5689 RepID=A0A640KE15_LEITA|nr:hypothetical protein, conserved [Leishmania tarentolae]
MSSHELPFLILNLAVEMMFVLNSRLHAQAVPPEKATSVLRDIGENIFDAAFVEELFASKKMYPSASVLQVLTALSSSTMMRLSENSMRKLYDLVYMTVKYQVFTLRHPLELLELMLNHLDAAQRILPADLRPLISAVEERVLLLARTLDMGDWASIRRSLLNFFLSRHVRVSVFLESNMQDGTSGAFYIPRDAFLSPSPSCKPPGLVYMEGVPYPGTFAHPDAHLPYPPHVPMGSWRPQRGVARMTSNGFDIYAAVGPALSKSAAAVSTAGAHATPVVDPLPRQTLEIPVPKKLTSDAVGAVTASSSSSAPPPASAATEDQQSAYNAEVNYLAQLIGSVNRARDLQHFELDLFQDSADSGGETTSAVTVPSTASTSITDAASSRGAAPAPAIPVIRMTASAVQEQNKKLLGIMRDFQSPKKTGTSDAGGAGLATGGAAINDLLDIMDEL